MITLTIYTNYIYIYIYWLSGPSGIIELTEIIDEFLPKVTKI